VEWFVDERWILCHMNRGQWNSRHMRIIKGMKMVNDASRMKGEYSEVLE
jgi:hypothetical protein